MKLLFIFVFWLNAQFMLKAINKTHVEGIILFNGRQALKSL